MQPTPHDAHDADEGFERWYLGGAPGADDEDIVADPQQRPPMPAPAPPARREGWLAAAGSLAALALLWSFYGVVDGAVERSELRAQAPAEATLQADGRADGRADGQAQVDRVHAIYSLPDAGSNVAPAVHYTRWP